MKTGLGQQQLAKACGCGQTTISDIARGATSEPRAGIALHLLRVARDRHVSLDEIGEALRVAEAALLPADSAESLGAQTGA